MQFIRFIRALVPLLFLSLVGFVIGCSSRPESTPPDKESGKKIAEELKQEKAEMKAARQEAAKGRSGMGDRMKGRGPG